MAEYPLALIHIFMNLLPFPALDGGRLVFLVIEAIRRKPINRQVEGGIHFAGDVYKRHDQRREAERDFKVKNLY